MNPPIDRRRLLLDLYRAALEAVGGRAAVAGFLRGRDRPPRRIVAIGKAAREMTLGALDLIDPAAPPLVITPHGHRNLALAGRCLQIEAGHPLPDAESLRAGEELIRYIDDAAPHEPLLFLISGGASALVERLPDGIPLETLRAAHQWLLGSGLGIEAMNRLRKRLSCIKSGRLARRLRGRPALALLISDVPGDDPAVIGSGLLAPDRDDSPLPEGLPEWFQPLLHKAPPAPPPDDPCFAAVETHLIASQRGARSAAVAAARAAGLAIHDHGELLGESGAAARQVAEALRDGAEGVHLWGGEAALRLPPLSGRGGRCQHLALQLAIAIQGRDDLLLLAAGSDGNDGGGDDAGALVDGGSLERGEAEGWDAVESLRRADSGSFLEASGDLLHTGPTGTNVMDLVLALKLPPQGRRRVN